MDLRSITRPSAQRGHAFAGLVSEAENILCVWAMRDRIAQLARGALFKIAHPRRPLEARMKC